MNPIKIPTTKPTPAEVKAARQKARLTQRQASRMIFGPDSHRPVQNWESGATTVPLGKYIFFLLMTGQVTVAEARKAVEQ